MQILEKQQALQAAVWNEANICRVGLEKQGASSCSMDQFWLQRPRVPDDYPCSLKTWNPSFRFQLSHHSNYTKQAVLLDIVKNDFAIYWSELLDKRFLHNQHQFRRLLPWQPGKDVRREGDAIVELGDLQTPPYLWNGRFCYLDPVVAQLPSVLKNWTCFW